MSITVAEKQGDKKCTACWMPVFSSLEFRTIGNVAFCALSNQTHPTHLCRNARELNNKCTFFPFTITKQTFNKYSNPNRRYRKQYNESIENFNSSIHLSKTFEFWKIEINLIWRKKEKNNNKNRTRKNDIWIWRAFRIFGRYIFDDDRLCVSVERVGWGERGPIGSARRVYTHAPLPGRYAVWKCVTDAVASIHCVTLQACRYLLVPKTNFHIFIKHSWTRNNKDKMREIVHIQAGQCGNQIGAKVSYNKTPRDVHFRSLPFRKTVTNSFTFFPRHFSSPFFSHFL